MSSLLQNVELLIWSPATKADPPPVAAMGDALDAENFRRDLAEPVPVTTAFRRTVTAKQGKVGGEEYRATVWANGKLRGQIDRLDTDPDTHRIRRTWMAGWTLEDEKTGACGGGPDDITEVVRAATRQYTWSDVSGIIQAILKQDGLGAYSLRRSGGVYVVPTAGRGLLDRLARTGERIGLNVLRYDIPDNRAQRDEIAGAIADSLSADCDAHEAALAAYTPEQTKPGVVVNRREAVAQTRRLAEQLAPHMGERAAGIYNRCNDLLERCATVLAAVQNYRAPTTGGRRIAIAPTAAVA